MLSLVRRRDDDLPVPANVAAAPGERYTVLLLDESQLDRLLERQGVQGFATSQAPTVITPRSRRSPSRLWPLAFVVGTVAAVLVTAALVLWPSPRTPAAAPVAAPPSDVAPVAPDTAPVVSTGASFSVDAGAFASDGAAQAAAKRLASAGWPSFTWRLDQRRRHVLVGPYVSIDEAENALRLLGSVGYANSKLHVDDRLRVTAAAVSSQRRLPQYPDVVLVAAPGRLSFVFELADEPRHVSGERVGATSFVLTAGPLVTPVERQVWTAPGDVRLVSRVALSPKGQDATMFQAVVTLAETADASVRLYGRRVYVDVFRRLDEVTPLEDQFDVPARRPPSTAAAAGRAAGPVSPAQPPVAAPAGTATATASAGSLQDYRSAVGPFIARFEEIQPFLRSTVSSASTDVLAALTGTCSELETGLSAVVVPSAAQSTHGLFVSAVQLARTATSLSFREDRAALVREAFAQFSAAKARLQDLAAQP